MRAAPRPPRPLHAAVLILALAVTACSRQAAAAPGYTRRELAVPMRDGTSLHAVALIPVDTTRPLPILLIRTPFGAARELGRDALPPGLRELAQDGYIFVAQDIRGRGGSGGTFVTTRPQRDPSDPKGVDESTDAYDTIDWLVKHVPHNNGRVGVLGYSYRGWLAGLAGVGAHPALKAISPQAPTTDTWMGDDFFHQGAFRQTQGVLYAGWIEGKGVEIPDSNQYDFYLRFPTLDSLAKATGVGELPSWVGFRTHPAYDDYWRSRAMQRVLVQPEVPTLFVGGWWDAEDILGPQLAYATVERADTATAENRNHVVLGPWYHGQWVRPGGDSIGPVALGSATADWFRANVQRPWFAHWLHGTGDGRFPEAWVFETGANRWDSLDAWPPRNARPRNLYLRAGGMLAFDPPPAGASSDSTQHFSAWIADPAHPVPYVRQSDDGSGWNTWLVQDQRFLAGRPDVRSWVSAPLAEDLTIAGDVVAHLFASTTGTDADWVVKLIDVSPDPGYELMVNADILRGRYWKGFDRATPIPANTVTPFTVDLHQQLYRFRKGHRIMVQVQSSWFPLYDRNPQTFVPNIFQAKASDFTAQTHRVWHTPQWPSRVTVSVLPERRP